MKLFLSSSFANVAPLFFAFVQHQQAGKKVAFIATASLPEEVTFYVDEGRSALKNAGMQVEELDIASASREQIATVLAACDYIYISGGNTFFLLQEFKRSGADQLIREQLKLGKVYMGESAGTMVLAADIHYSSLMDDAAAATALESTTALGLVDFYPLPHFGEFPFAEACEAVMAEYQQQLNIVPFNNAQAIVVQDGVFEVLE